MDPRYDVAVIGVGSMGASACFSLAVRGLRVLGLEQFGIPNELSSHAGQTRIIRKAYFEDAAYVPLLESSYAGWKQLEAKAGEQIYFETGLLYQGPAQHPVIEGVLHSARKHGISLREGRAACGPHFQFHNSSVCLFEPEAGYLLPDRAISCFTRLARHAGANIRSHEVVLSWNKTGNEFRIETKRGVYHSARLVITAGAWTAKICPSLNEHLRITRQLLGWMDVDDPEQYLPDRFPCWMIASKNFPGVLYGFPYMEAEPKGLKAALHFPGEVCDPDTVNREVSSKEQDELLSLVRGCLPGVTRIRETKVCLYANSPDENFILDFVPGYEGAAVMACGFSGHGFKFVPVVGDILTDLVEKGETNHPIEFLRLARLK
ncbi:MAG TPA: N-methyl-L-tryptophan oxidase [Chitinophagaceae bacterium]|nr:N-methyl-L-tryptophan oxidase [Chitinophagaceae bacterium]